MNGHTVGRAKAEVEGNQKSRKEIPEEEEGRGRACHQMKIRLQMCVMLMLA